MQHKLASRLYRNNVQNGKNRKTQASQLKRRKLRLFMKRGYTADDITRKPAHESSHKAQSVGGFEWKPAEGLRE